MVLAGGYREEMGRRSIDYDQLTIVYHPPGTAHVDQIGPVGASFLVIEPDLELIAASELRFLNEGYPTVMPREAAFVALQLLRTHHDFRAHEALGLDLLGSVAATSQSTPPSWLHSVLARINDEYATPPSSQELAEDAGVHPVHLARVVRQHTGTTIAGLVRRRRVEKSIALLHSGESLATIALRCGFSDQAHFTRVFRSESRFTPAELRRLL